MQHWWALSRRRRNPLPREIALSSDRSDCHLARSERATGELALAGIKLRAARRAGGVLLTLRSKSGNNFPGKFASRLVDVAEGREATAIGDLNPAVGRAQVVRHHLRGKSFDHARYDRFTRPLLERHAAQA